jgi:hypothetical protein
VSGTTVRQPARFRAVISADQQSFALRRLPGLWAAVQMAVIIVCDIGAVIVVATGITSILPGRSQNLPTGTIALACGLLMVWVVIGLHFRRPVVSVTPSELRARGVFGVTHRAQRFEIASIDLKAKTYGRQVTALRVPYVRKTSGGGFWLDALADDTERRPPDPAQLEVLRQLRAALNVTGR